MSKKQKKLWVKIWDLTTTVLLVIFCLYALLFVSLSFINKNAVVKYLGFANYEVLTDSMDNSGKFKTGDWIIVVPCNPEKLKEGDIITFTTNYYLEEDHGKYDSLIFTHYYDYTEYVNDKMVVHTKCHPANEPEEKKDPFTTSPDDIIGKVGMKVDFMKPLMGFVRSPIGIFSIIFGIGTIGVGIYAFRTWNNERKENKLIAEGKLIVDKDGNVIDPEDDELDSELTNSDIQETIVNNDEDNDNDDNDDDDEN